MAQKCVHRGCEKSYTDEAEPCIYHPGPPVFHEGQKGWKCCKPRVLTFDEFMSITPCTSGTHSTTDYPPVLEKTVHDASATPQITPTTDASLPPPAPRIPINSAAATPPPVAPPPEVSDTDDAALEVPDGRTCRRKTCGVQYVKGSAREGEKCIHHPGVPIFHEGSKGYSCCKRRVLEFDEFMKIEGCKTKTRHLFVGSGKTKGASSGNRSGEEVVETIRHDFYQTGSAVIASFFLKKINKDTATITFPTSTSVALDLVTTDSSPKRHKSIIDLFGTIDPEKSGFKIMGTKLELTLVKADGASWPVLRADEKPTGEIIQVGRAGRAT